MKTDNSWYALAGSLDLYRESMLPITLFGQRLVLWRDGEGHAHLWKDRCPHRGSRLTIGRITNCELMCRYHGWRFDSSGTCVAVPALPDLLPSATLRVQTFKVCERFGLIWGSLEDPPPDLALGDFGASGRTDVFCRSFPTRAPAAVVADESLKFNFIPYEKRDGDQVVYTAQSLSSSVVKITCSRGAASEIAAICIQPASDQRCVAHLVVSLHRASAETAQARRHFNRQFESIRYRAENQPVEVRV